MRAYKNILPELGQRVYIDPSADVIGKVKLDDDASVWPKTVIRGDVNHISIGKRSNIQDGCIIHVSRPRTDLPDGWPTIIEEDVTIGHGVILHGCHIKSRVLVGNGAIVLDGAVIESDVMIGAGALVPPGKHLESGFLYIGSPCKQARKLRDSEIEHLPINAENYLHLKKEYLQD